MARIARIVAGFTLIIAGAFLLVLPGPGIVTIVAGLALLAKDLAWAGRLAQWAQVRFESVLGRQKTTDEGDEG